MKTITKKNPVNTIDKIEKVLQRFIFQTLFFSLKMFSQMTFFQYKSDFTREVGKECKVEFYQPSC